MNSHGDPVSQGVKFLDAVLSSMSTDQISPKDWWTRAASGLEAAAASADDFAQMTSKAAKKLQIDAYNESSSVNISELNSEFENDFEAFQAFRSVCQRDAIYITAIARAERTAKKKTKERK